MFIFHRFFRFLPSGYNDSLFCSAKITLQITQMPCGFLYRTDVQLRYALIYALKLWSRDIVRAHRARGYINYSLFLIPYSSFLIPYSLFLIPYSLFLPTPQQPSSNLQARKPSSLHSQNPLSKKIIHPTIKQHLHLLNRLPNQLLLLIYSFDF